MPIAPKSPPSVSRTLKSSMSKPSFFRAYFSVIKKPYLVFCFLVFGKSGLGLLHVWVAEGGQLEPRPLQMLPIATTFTVVKCVCWQPFPLCAKCICHFDVCVCRCVCLFDHFSWSIYSVCGNCFLLLLGLFIGSGGAFMTVYDQILIHAGYIDDQKYVGYLGIAMQVFASFAVLTVSRWIDLTKSY